MDGSSLSTLVQMVGAGLGVTLIPEMAVDIETRSADVSVDRVRGAGPGAHDRHDLATFEPPPFSEQLREMSDAVREAAGRGA